MIKGFCCSISSLFAVASYAQSVVKIAPNGEGSDVVTFKPLVVTAHYDIGLGSSDAASQGIVKGKLLQDVPLLRPGEVLETVPGLVVTQHSGDGKANQYWLRGYNLDHGTDFATSVDGVPVNMPTHAHGQGYSDLNFLIPEIVDTIQYKKGPYFAENGDFAAAGSADIQYRNRLDANIANFTLGSFGYARALFAGSTQLSAKSNDTDGAIDITNPTLLGAFEALHEDGPWKTPENLRKLNGLVKLSAGNKSNGWSIGGQFYQASWTSTDQVPISLIQSGELCRYCSMDNTDGGKTSHQIVSGEWHRKDDDSYTKASFFAKHSDLQLWSNFTYYAFQPYGDQFEQIENRNVLGAKLQQGWYHNLFGLDSTTEVGLQVRHDNVNVGLKNTQARVVRLSVSQDKVSETLYSTYLKNTTKWTPWLRSVVGMRLDHVEMDLRSSLTAQNSGSTQATIVQPKVSLILGPWKKTEFFINAGKGFHRNDARGVIDQVDPLTGSPTTAVPALVKSTGKEVGVRTEWIPNLQSSLALWSLNSASELVYETDYDPVAGSISANGASTRYGVEWNNHYANKWLYIDADFAWTRARYTNRNDNGELGNYIPNAVSRVGLFKVVLHDHGLGPWTAGIEMRYIGRSPLTQDGTLWAPSSIVTNLRGEWRFSKNVALNLDILNLFNRKYYDIAYAQDYRLSPTSPFVSSGVTAHPGEPFQVRMTLKLKF